jgi:hypothetical protein
MYGSTPRRILFVPLTAAVHLVATFPLALQS